MYDKLRSRYKLKILPFKMNYVIKKNFRWFIY